MRRLALHPLDFEGEKEVPRASGEAVRLPGAIKNTGDSACALRKPRVSRVAFCRLLRTVDKLVKAALDALKDRAFHEKLRTLGFDVIANGPEGLRTRVAAEVPRYRDIIAKAGIERV